MIRIGNSTLINILVFLFNSNLNMAMETLPPEIWQHINEFLPKHSAAWDMIASYAGMQPKDENDTINHLIHHTSFSSNTWQELKQNVLEKKAFIFNRNIHQVNHTLKIKILNQLENYESFILNASADRYGLETYLKYCKQGIKRFFQISDRIPFDNKLEFSCLFSQKYEFSDLLRHIIQYKLYTLSKAQFCTYKGCLKICLLLCNNNSEKKFSKSRKFFKKEKAWMETLKILLHDCYTFEISNNNQIIEV